MAKNAPDCTGCLFLKSTTKSSTVNQLGGQASFFFVGNVFTLLVGFPLQIYIAKKLGADGLGIFSLLEGGIGLALGLLAFGLAPTLVKFIPMHLERGEYNCIRKLVFRGVVILFGVGSLTYLLLLLAMPIAIEQWPIISEHQTAMAIMALLIPLSLLIFFLQQGLRGFQEIRYMVIGSSFMQLTVKATLAVLFLSVGFHLIGYVWAVVLSTFCAAAWLAVGLWRKIRSLPKVSEVNCDDSTLAWRNYAKVMYSNSLLGTGTQYLDRFLLAIFAGTSSVGILVVVKQLQQMPVIFLQMFLAVAAPMLSAAHARNDIEERQHIYHLTTDWIVRLSAPLFIFFMVFSEYLLSIYGDGFAHEGKYALWILLVGQMINLGFGLVGNVLNMNGMEGFMLKLSIYQVAIQVVGLVIMVPEYGLVGAALAISVGVIINNLTSMWAIRKKLGMHWGDQRYWRWIFPIAMCISASALALYYGPQQPGALVLLLYLVILYALFNGVSLIQGLHEDDKELLGHLRDKLLGERR
ncbi:MAG: oligosaccharide flippase family protein [Candidatus Jacksonbacteria bacterium]|nr:oligosaccharide flippase family protein [Candidatus Jacksonbacteria bacterium]